MLVQGSIPLTADLPQLRLPLISHEALGHAMASSQFPSYLSKQFCRLFQEEGTRWPSLSVLLWQQRSSS